MTNPSQKVTSKERVIDLRLGDCLEVMKGMVDKSVDVLLTDIPYNEVNRESSGLRNLDKGNADTLNIPIDTLTHQFMRLTKGSGYIFCGYQQISPIIKVVKEYTQSVRLLVWNKTNPSPMNGDKLWLSSIEPIVFFRFPNATFNEHCKGGVVECSTEPSKLHPTQKPVKLFRHLISASSNEGDVIFDPFMGSGTAGIASKELKRDFIGIELDPTYFEIAKKRIQGAQEMML